MIGGARDCVVERGWSGICSAEPTTRGESAPVTTAIELPVTGGGISIEPGNMHNGQCGAEVCS